MRTLEWATQFRWKLSAKYVVGPRLTRRRPSSPSQENMQPAIWDAKSAQYRKRTEGRTSDLEEVVSLGFQGRPVDHWDRSDQAL
jgi:hypothetical protein